MAISQSPYASYSRADAGSRQSGVRIPQIRISVTAATGLATAGNVGRGCCRLGEHPMPNVPAKERPREPNSARREVGQLLRATQVGCQGGHPKDSPARSNDVSLWIRGRSSMKDDHFLAWTGHICGRLQALDHLAGSNRAGIAFAAYHHAAGGSGVKGQYRCAFLVGCPVAK